MADHVIPDDALLADLAATCDELGRAPTHTEHRDRGDHDPDTISVRFGSWSAAIQLVGYEPRPSQRAHERRLMLERASAGGDV